MSLENLVYKILNYFSWLLYRRWETRERLIAIAIIVGIFLTLGIKAHRRKKNRLKQHTERLFFH